MTDLTIECEINVVRRRQGRKELYVAAAVDKNLPVGRLPRVTRLMALAIRFDTLLRSRKIPDHATLARLGRVTQARMTQIMNLLLLAPDIQEELLFLPRTLNGRDPIHLRLLQPISAVTDWREQRQRWRELCEQRLVSPQQPSDLEVQ